VPRFDYVWWLLSANPFVILGDATPTRFTEYGYPDDLFGSLKLSVRSAQLPPSLEQRWDDCAPGTYLDSTQPTPRQIIDETVPSWFVGLAVQVRWRACCCGAPGRAPARRRVRCPGNAHRIDLRMNSDEDPLIRLSPRAGDA
jgi:hypothetical protein